MRKLRKAMQDARRLDGDPAHSREVLDVAGRVASALWAVAACAALVMLLVPGGLLEHWLLVIALAGGALALSFVIWRIVERGRSSTLLMHLWTIAGLAMVAGLVAATGGSQSPGHAYLYFVVVYAALFYAPGVAIAYAAACAVVRAAPVLYEGAAVDLQLWRELTIVGTSYLVIGGAILVGRGLLVRASARARALGVERERLAAQQASLRRVATAVAAGSPPQAVFALVSSEAGRLLHADAAGIARFEAHDRAQVLGTWAREGAAAAEPGRILALEPHDELRRVHDRGEPVCINKYPPDLRTHFTERGYRAFLGAPIRTGNALWGSLVTAALRPGAFPAGAKAQAQEYADLIATAVANAEDRARLQREAAVDGLTGLANHRAFGDRLDQEASRAWRHGRPLSVALVDADGFRDLTESAGPQAGDTVLAELADLLRAGVREEDVVARLAGDEFAILFVEDDREAAYAAMEHARQEVAATAFARRHHLTVTVGICDLETAGTPDALLRLAEAALYWGERHGRDVTCVYDPAVVQELDAGERIRRPERAQALLGLRALARAIDAKDPTTDGHCERVAALAARLALALGWPEERAQRLRQAALLHDVGKIGVPEGILLKPGRLDEDEFDLMREHAALGARIVTDVLDPEQGSWVAGHHERPDGRGYPRGLHGEQIPEGASVLALADAWDAMTTPRWYAGQKTVDQALREIRALAGRQFAATAVAALEILHDRGEPAMAAARMHRPSAAPGGHAPASGTAVA